MSTYGAHCGKIGVSQFGAPEASESDSDEGEVDLSDPDKDMDWGEVTDHDTDEECLY
jgi:hypothetical protein